MNKHHLLSLIAALVLAPAAHAVIPVVDLRALIQLATEVKTLENQLNTARSQLSSLTGSRGMQHLAQSGLRNYLPQDLAQLGAVLDQTSLSFGSLSTSLKGIVDRNAVLTSQDLSQLTPSQRQLIEAGRQNAALLASLTGTALAHTSERFTALQQLIDAIGSASDPKAILDLQARVQTETGMLQNEQIKLATLYQSTVAAEQLRAQRVREQALADIGHLSALPALGL